MNFSHSLSQLTNLLLNTHQAFITYLESKESKKTSSYLFLKLHLPLLFLTFISVSIAPYNFLLKEYSWANVMFVFVLISFFLLISLIYDRFSLYVHPVLKIPREEEEKQQRILNIAFFFQLPICGIGFFFFIHPYLGYSLLILIELFSTILSWEYTAFTRRISRARSISYWLFTCSLIMLLICLVLFLFAIIRSVKLFI